MNIDQKLHTDPVCLANFMFLLNKENSKIRYVHYSVFTNSSFQSGPRLRFNSNILKSRTYKRVFDTFTSSIGGNDIDKSAIIDMPRHFGKFRGPSLRFDWYLVLIAVAPSNKIEWNEARKAVFANWFEEDFPTTYPNALNSNFNVQEGTNSNLTLLSFHENPPQTPTNFSHPCCTLTTPASTPRLIAPASTPVSIVGRILKLSF